MNKRGFASDNNAGISPEVLHKLSEVNDGHVIGYGDDPYTDRAKNLIKENFGGNAEVFFVFTGTGANVLGLTAASKPYNSVFCSSTAHIYVDECGAPERFSGCKLIPIATPDGKLTPDLLESNFTGFGFEHHSQPGIISISQSTEMGTVYTPAEIRKIADLAHKYGMYLHLDGARLANAAVALGCGFRDITSLAGVDILSFGGTKNGLMFAESVVFFNDKLCGDFKYIRKQGMQLASKMRFTAAQFIAYFEDELWKKNASHANAMAQKLFHAVRDIPGVKITQKVEANGVFVILPKAVIPKLQKEFFFYVWDEATGEVRWMTSFDTTEEDIDAFAQKIHELI